MDSLPPQPEKDLKSIMDELLREKNVSSNASWEYALKLIGNDSRYELFRHHPERKQMFNNYKIQKAKEEKEEQRQKTKRCRENLEKMLYSSEKMNSSVRYRTACEMFALNDAWKSVPDSDRREIFREVVEEMAVKEKESLKAIRKRNMKVLSEILDGMTSVNFRTRWEEAQQLLLDNPVFAEDADLLGMDKEDALIVFEDHIRELEKEEEEERRREKNRMYRQQRKNREAFTGLLDHLHKQGKLTSISKWSNLYPEISTDSRFIALLSQPLSGSTALDLFKFYVEDLRNRYEEDKEIIRDILKKNSFDIDLNTSYEDFCDVLSKDNRSDKVDAGNVKIVFERLIAKAKEKERERQKIENKRRKKLETAFMNLLHSLEPAVDENSVWEHVRKAIADDDAFLAIPNEEERISLFKSYIQTMLETCSHHHSKSKKKSSSKKKMRKQRSNSWSSGSESDDDEVEREEGEEKQRRRERTDRRRSYSRSVTPVASSSRRPSRSRDRETSRRSYRRSYSRSSSSDVEQKPRPVRSRSGSANAMHAPTQDAGRRETESETSDIEELEKQRQILLSQLAAAAQQ